MNPYTVIALYESGEILSEHTQAEDGDDAFRKVATAHHQHDLEFVVAINGHLDLTLTFPGGRSVYSTDILSNESK